VESLATATAKELGPAGIGEKKALEVIRKARSSMALTFIRVDELLKMRQTVLRLTTGSKMLDELLGGRPRNPNHHRILRGIWKRQKSNVPSAVRKRAVTS